MSILNFTNWGRGRVSCWRKEVWKKTPGRLNNPTHLRTSELGAHFLLGSLVIMPLWLGLASILFPATPDLLPLQFLPQGLCPHFPSLEHSSSREPQE